MTKSSRPEAVGSRIRLLEGTLSNGIRVVVHENCAAPMVVMRLSLVASTSHDAPGTAGLANLVAVGLGRGTTSRSFAEINATTDAAGMSLGASAGRHQSIVSFRCLTEDLDLAIDLAADIARNPTFPDDEVSTLLGQVRNGLRQADNDTGSVANRHFRERCFPVGHPYRLRAHGALATVEAIGAADLRTFHAANFGAKGAVVVVSGDIEYGRVMELLEARLGDWDTGTAVRVHVPAPPAPEPARQDAFLDGKTQADLVVGAPCIARDHPDFHPLRIANLIFGRLGMMGRLGESVREARGLAYGIWSDLDASVGAGPWSVRAGVNPRNVEAALDAIRAELARLRSDGVRTEEFERAKRFSTGSVALQLETNDGVANTVGDMILHGLGLDYIDRYPSIIHSASIDDVNRAAQVHLPPSDRLVVSVCGPQA